MICLSLRDAIAGLQARLAEAEQAAHELPHGEKYVLLTTGFIGR